MITLQELIRMGCTNEAEEVFEAVGLLCKGAPSKRIEQISRLNKAYKRCQTAYAEMLEEVESYKQADGTPAKLKYKWTT